MLLTAEVVGDLILQGGLQDPFGQLLQQPAVSGRLQSLRAGTVRRHGHQLLVRHGHRRPGQCLPGRPHGLQFHCAVRHVTSRP
ncbi:hypothetical protein WN71_035570 [Streptomyces mangrovisoli]|uniref:Uncharacterized protein n=1 Tax=Streptomyces mangrovisoli TaxID=1428628 RepID=A0A1J4NLF9_9ACTN|nr:hypothetical protein WN71_035570 [Streptomyces mangrovisoli]